MPRVMAGRTAVRTSRLMFRPIGLKDMAAINRLLPLSGSRACDATIGGIYMWADYFKYEYCIYRDTLFIAGVSEGHMSLPAFSLPIGMLPLSESIGLLRDYCRAKGLPLRMSAVPDDRLASIPGVERATVEELTDWGDYIYDAESLATLSGKKLSKKRNHVNRFMLDNPGYRLDMLTADNASEVKAAYMSWEVQPDGSATAGAERDQTIKVLDHYGLYPFEGAVLRDGRGDVVAFTAGELSGDTLHVHIEKMNHAVAGAGETVNKLFASRMLDRYGMRYINREDDSGDPGLRQAKQSYNPAMILRKYDVTMP